MKQKLLLFLSRKFILVVFVIILATILNLTGKLSSSDFVEVVKWTATIYILGNVGQQFKEVFKNKK